MFSFSEIILILIIALLVLGPKQLITLAHHTGRWMRYGQNLWAALTVEIKKNTHGKTPS